MSDVVALDSIRDCLRAGLPSPLATCRPDGTPDMHYIWEVRYLDAERVATSRQDFNHALAQFEASPFSQVLVVRPGTAEQFRLDLRYLHSVTEGEEFEAMRANVDAVAAHTGPGSAFRLRGMDVHHVLRCRRVERPRDESRPAAAPDPLVPLEQFVRRLERATGRDETLRELVDALDDLFGFRYAAVIAPGDVPAGGGLIATAAARRRTIVLANFARARALTAPVDGGEGPRGRSGLADAQSAAAVPLVVGRELVGVLYLESTQPSAFSGPTEGLLRIVGAHAAAALAARGAPTAQRPSGADPAPVMELVIYRADDTVLCDSAYVVKGAPGRILWSMLKAHVESGRTLFSNRELRLDESLELPAGNDNLEARLLVLRRRLADIDCGVTLERVGRGRLELRLARPAELTEVPTRLFQRPPGTRSGAVEG